MRPGRLTPRGWPPVRVKTQARGQVQELPPVQLLEQELVPKLRA